MSQAASENEPGEGGGIRVRLQNIWNEQRKKVNGALVGILLSMGIGFVLLTTGLGDGLVHRSYDLPFAIRPFIFPKEVVMVYLDDPSYKHLGQLYTEHWDRDFHTRLIKRLTAEKAQAVIFDVLFSDVLDPVKDQAFVKAMQESGKVILAADWEIEDEKKTGGIDTPPAQIFNESAADLGSTALFPDEDLYVRQYLPHRKPDLLNPNPIASEAWSAAVLIGADISHDTNRSHEPFWINYYGPTLTLPTVSLYQALADNDPAAPPGFFSNKVVFVGEHLQTKMNAVRKDEYPSPFSYLPENKFIPGVTIHATAFLNLLRQDWLNRFPFWVERAAIAIFGILFGAGFVFCRPMMAIVFALLSTIPIALVNYFLFVRYHYWFPWLVVIVAQIPAALVWSVAFSSVQLLLEKARVEQTMNMYIPPKLVKKFGTNPEFLKPGAKKQMLTILFSDIAGFTTISEGMDSDDLAKLMNRYFQSAVNDCIHATDGTIVKYIGDAIFAFWNAPDFQNDHAFQACEAGLLFRAQDNHEVQGKKLLTRIGLHTGVANVGNFGSTARVDYTAIGENINLASRMEGLNKYLGTRILITNDTKAEIGDRMVTRYLGLFVLKGFERAVGVYELVALLAQEAETHELRKRFAEALEIFVTKDFEKADAAFRRVLELKPDDGPSEFYLEQLEELKANIPPPEWKGEITLKDK